MVLDGLPSALKGHGAAAALSMPVVQRDQSSSTDLLLYVGCRSSLLEFLLEQHTRRLAGRELEAMFEWCQHVRFPAILPVLAAGRSGASPVPLLQHRMVEQRHSEWQWFKKKSQPTK